MTGRSASSSARRRSSTPQRNAGVLPWLGLIGSIAMAVVVTVFAKMLFINFVEMYNTYGKELPWLSRLYHDNYLLAWLGPVAVALCWYIGRDSWGPRVAGLLGLLIALVGAVSTIFALYLPYINMGSLV
ncbi:hypothetical protein [Stenotrophomonas sp. 278]|uniref:hypothetical protein n=1 Tax=Stenotrophomonas sp. 278 TaxID=2479851 RepID=UPI000F6671F8|nr:hypothetical protein [Stenotrophomonas sp. 278]